MIWLELLKKISAWKHSRFSSAVSLEFKEDAAHGGHDLLIFFSQ